MPRRKFGVSNPNLENVVKSFLQCLGYSNFTNEKSGRAIAKQVPSKDLKIKFRNFTNISMTFRGVTTTKDNQNFEFILCSTKDSDEEQRMMFVVYVSPQNTFRAFVPTKGNTFCKKKKKAYGYCGCHSGSGNPPHKGDMDDEISKRFECGALWLTGIPTVTDASVKIGQPTDIWVGGAIGEGKAGVKVTLETYVGDFGQRDVFSNLRTLIKSNQCFQAPTTDLLSLSSGSTSKTMKKVRRIFDTLPPELVEIVIKFCDIFSILLRFRKVCKLWNTIILQPRVQKDLFDLNWEKMYNSNLNIRTFRSSLSQWCRLPLLHTFNMDGTYESPWMKLNNNTKSQPDYTVLNYYYSKLYFCMNKIHDIHPKSLEWMSSQFNSHTPCELLPLILKKNLDHHIVPNLNCDNLREKYPAEFGEYYCDHDPRFCSVEMSDCRLLQSKAYEDLTKMSKVHWPRSPPPQYAPKCSDLIKTLRKCFRFPNEFDFFEDFEPIHGDINTPDLISLRNAEEEPYCINSQFRANDGGKISNLFESYIYHEKNFRKQYSWDGSSSVNNSFDHQSKKCMEMLRNDLFHSSEVSNETIVKFSNFASEEVSLVFWMCEVENYFVGFWFIVERDS